MLASTDTLSFSGCSRSFPSPAGAIPPFGRLYGLETYVDRELLNTREITMPAGDLETSIRMRADEYRRLHRVREGDFAAA